MFIEKLKSHLTATKLLPTGAKLLLAVSGGNDSMALVTSLHTLAAHFQWRIFVVHVNHQLRGAESEGDAAYVADYCQQRNITCVIKTIDVRGAKAIAGGNKQAIARQLRYKAFHEAAKELGIRHIVLAHHADDQVETVLQRLLRGTGTQGLAGMSEKRDWQELTIVRPLLPFSRAELETYGTQCHLVPRDDSSNQSLAYTRNRLRHDLIPQLQRYNPQLKQAILQLSDVIQAEELVWTEWTQRVIDDCVEQIDDDTYELDLPSFLSQPLALQRRTIKLILNCLMDENPPYQAIEQVIQLGLHPSPSVWIVLPGGIKGVRNYTILRLTRDYIRPQPIQWHYSLPIPCELLLPTGKMKAVLRDDLPFSLPKNQHIAVFDADQLPLDRLAVRNRRLGDTMQVFGFSGHKRVKSLLIDYKVPRDQRDSWPIVVADDQIIWLAGIRRAGIAPVDPHTQRYLLLQWDAET